MFPTSHLLDNKTESLAGRPPSRSPAWSVSPPSSCLGYAWTWIWKTSNADVSWRMGLRRRQQSRNPTTFWWTGTRWNFQASGQRCFENRKFACVTMQIMTSRQLWRIVGKFWRLRPEARSVAPGKPTFLRQLNAPPPHCFLLWHMRYRCEGSRATVRVMRCQWLGKMKIKWKQECLWSSLSK